MEIALIAAVAENGVIGSNGQIPWRIPEDVQHFKKLTLYHAVVMGRKTYESIPGRFRPLVDRVNIVLSRHKGEYPAGVYAVSSLEEAIDTAQHVTNQEQRDDHDESINDRSNINRAYIIGGEILYRQVMPLAQQLEITHVHRTVEGDAFFPAIDASIWKVEKQDDKEGYSFVTYTRK